MIYAAAAHLTSRITHGVASLTGGQQCRDSVD